MRPGNRRYLAGQRFSAQLRTLRFRSGLHQSHIGRPRHGVIRFMRNSAPPGHNARWGDRRRPASGADLPSSPRGPFYHVVGSLGYRLSGAAGGLDPAERTGRPVHRPGPARHLAPAVSVAGDIRPGRGRRTPHRHLRAAVARALRDRPDARPQSLRHPLRQLPRLRRRVPQRRPDRPRGGERGAPPPAGARGLLPARRAHLQGRLPELDPPPHAGVRGGCRACGSRSS